jgi:hypothetical protein
MDMTSGHLGHLYKHLEGWRNREVRIETTSILAELHRQELPLMATNQNSRPLLRAGAVKISPRGGSRARWTTFD